MTERVRQEATKTIPDLLRSFHYLDPRNCDLSSFLFQQPTSSGALRTFHITRISTSLSFKDQAGRFDLSFDHIRPKIQVDYFEPPIEQVENPLPATPCYRINMSRSNDINNPIELIVDETFEPSAATIHRKLMKEIVDLKKAKGKEAYNEISKILQQIREFSQ